MEPLTPSTTVTTVCDHAFHTHCLRMYTRTKQVELAKGMLANGAPAVQVAQGIVVMHATGPPCPLCRKTMPLVHRMMQEHDTCVAGVCFDMNQMLKTVERTYRESN